MKKFTTIKLMITMIALSINLAYAQTDFKFNKVSFVGAMDATDWTKGWTNWTPEQTVYPTVNESTTLNAAATGTGKIEITGNTTLDASKVYLLTGLVYVRSGGTLTIPAGTIIRAEGNASAANFASIVVQRGGKIVAIGSKSKPIVITSNKAEGYTAGLPNRKPGDWGGILILGKATNNLPAAPSTCTQCLKGEGLIEGPFGFPDGIHGGSDDNDYSGELEYVRIEFPGIVLAPNNEINGLTLGSVGRATLMRNIQVSYSNDDSYEWFGGTVNSKRIVAFRGTDDDFDTDFEIGRAHV